MDSKILLDRPGGAADDDDDDDVISSLPDDVLLRILSFVPTTKTEHPIRTRALSRRWRHVWLCSPALAFSDIGKTPTTPGLVELVDAALAHSHDTLAIHIEHPLHKLQANAWLQQAARRVHGKISLTLDYDHRPTTTGSGYYYQRRWLGHDKVVLDLPCGGGARTTAMSFAASLDSYNFESSALRLPTAPAVNSSLTALELVCIGVEGGSLSDFMSSCGQLRRLLIHFVRVVDCPDLRISNKLLEELDLDHIDGGLERLEVLCPKLRILRLNKLFGSPGYCKLVGRFCTPYLEEIDWPLCTLIPKTRVEFLGSLDTVRRLNVGLLTHVETYESHVGAWLLRSCTGVHRLDVSLRNNIKNDTDNDVVNLMEELPKLDSVTHLTVNTQCWRHMCGASIAELVSRCCQLRRLDVYAKYPSRADVCPIECPCKRPLEWTQVKLNLHFLEHVEIYNKYGADWIDDLNILLRRSSEANVQMHGPET